MHGSKNCPLYSKENDMDPLPVPEELCDLKYVEEQLIARVHPLISVFKLSGNHQFGYRGNIINFPQDVKSIAKTLPHTIENLSSLVTIRTRDEVNPKDFHVRAGKIRTALQKLKQINPHYHDTDISEENLSALPEDGNVFEKVTRVINIDSNENNNDEELNLDNGDDIQSNFITETCVPTMSKPNSNEKAGTILHWPTIGKDAINEFKTPGYIVMAFPCLFPYGKADLRFPREKQISPNQYFKHLMRYVDERFAKHPRFRYFALNSLMRWSALRNGGICVKKNTPFKDMNITQLKGELETNPNLLKKILFYNSNLRGTRSYWHSRGQELLAMIEQLGLPTLFFTLSSADLHWPDLFHYIAADEDINTMSEARRRTLIAENPLKVDTFFMERGEQFINKVLKEKYDVQDLWFRIEYQHRGSPHIHGVLWLQGAPKFDDLSKESPERLDEIAKYFDRFVSTSHPDAECPKGPIHPCREKLSDILDIQKDLAELLNRVQRHTQHREGYCLRLNKKTGKKECRFKFPFDLVEKTEIKVTEDNDVELLTARNDRYLNKYNDYIIQTWRANIDVSPVLSRRALINYLAKYVTKSETKSKEMTEILQGLINNTACDKPVKSIIQSLYIQSCCERDISAQETCHLLMGLPLHSAGGRQFVTINFKVLDAEGWVQVPDEEVSCQKSYIEKYMERPVTYNDKSLWYMAKNLKLPQGKRHPHGKEAIVQLYPRLSKKILDTSPEIFYRQKVLLFVPWRYEDALLETYGTWEEAYKENENLITSSFQPKCSLDGVEPSDSEFENIEPEESQVTDQWMCISRMGPSQNAEQVELGRRDLDVNHNWHESTDKYDQYGGVDAIKNFVFDERKKATLISHIPTMPLVEFTREQQTVLDLLKLQIESLKNDSVQNKFSLPQSVIVQGKAGTGKSLIIHAMKNMIYEAFGENAFVLLGPTGVSALNINGGTIHSKLYVHPKTRELMPLSGNALHDFRQNFEKTLFVIIDEYSMIGCNMLNTIEKRLKEALDNEETPYGGIFIYFFGDIQQLAPVGDTPAYNTNQVSLNHINGKLLYKSIDSAIVLSEVKRQNDVSFLNVLDSISTGNVTKEDYNILKNRFTTSVSFQEKESFADAIRLFPTRREVDNYNRNTLQNLKNPITKVPVPVARIPAQHNCAEAKEGSENEAGGLSSVLYLSKESKVMLRSNLWTEKALVNGAIGHIVDIVYKEGTNPPDEPPELLICHFDGYKGPYLNDIDKTVVTSPVLKQWKTKSGKDCTRQQFPISLSYACSIHKSQGLTLEKAYVNIGTLKEMSPGLTYTALSRVKSLSGILLEPFGFQRLESQKKKKNIYNNVLNGFKICLKKPYPQHIYKCRSEYMHECRIQM